MMTNSPASAARRRSAARTTRRMIGTTSACLLTALLATGCAGVTDSPGCETDLALTHHETGDVVELSEAVAVGVQDGAGYTAWAADFAFDEEVTTWFEPEIPAQGNLAWISLTVFSAEGEVPPLTAGERVPADAPHGEHVLVVVHRTATGDFGQSEGAHGSATLTEVGDRLCAEIDYSDDQKSLAGTLAATVVW